MVTNVEPFHRKSGLARYMLEHCAQEVLLAEKARQPKEPDVIPNLPITELCDQFSDIGHPLLQIVYKDTEFLVAWVCVLDPFLWYFLSLQTLVGVLCDIAMLVVTLKTSSGVVKRLPDLGQ